MIFSSGNHSPIPPEVKSQLRVANCQLHASRIKIIYVSLTLQFHKIAILDELKG